MLRTQTDLDCSSSVHNLTLVAKSKRAQACTSVTSATPTMWRDRLSGGGWAGTKAAGANRAVPVWKRAGHLELSGGGSHFGVVPAMEGLGHQPRLAMERPGPRTVRAPGDTVLTRQGVQASLSLAHPPSCPGRPDARGPQLTASCSHVQCGIQLASTKILEHVLLFGS